MAGEDVWVERKVERRSVALLSSSSSSRFESGMYQERGFSSVESGWELRVSLTGMEARRLYFGRVDRRCGARWALTVDVVNPVMQGK